MFRFRWGDLRLKASRPPYIPQTEDISRDKRTAERPCLPPLTNAPPVRLSSAPPFYSVGSENSGPDFSTTLADMVICT